MASSIAQSAPAARNFLDEHEMARIETATVTTSLSPESARLVRVERIVRAQTNLADQAHARGFYDFVLGRPSRAAAQGSRPAVSCQQGWAKGQQRRVALNGHALYETEKARSGGKWTWRIYREGHFQVEGSAPSETRADQQIEDAKADLLDRYGDWSRQGGARAQGEEPNDAEASGRRV